MSTVSSNLAMVILPRSLIEIGAQAFMFNYNLTEVIIKNTEGNVTISGDAFYATKISISFLIIFNKFDIKL